MPLQLQFKSFKIYYEDEITIAGENIEQWKKADNDGVECVAIFYTDGESELYSGKELYMLYDGKHGITFVTTTDKPNPWQELCEIDEIKVGKLMETHAFHEILKRAQGETYGS